MEESITPYYSLVTAVKLAGSATGSIMIRNEFRRLVDHLRYRLKTAPTVERTKAYRTLVLRKKETYELRYARKTHNKLISGCFNVIIAFMDYEIATLKGDVSGSDSHYHKAVELANAYINRAARKLITNTKSEI